MHITLDDIYIYKEKESSIAIALNNNAPACRVGRPRTRSAHQTPHAPVPKVSRPRSKSVHQAKAKDSKKNLPKQNPVKVTPHLEPRVIVVNPVDQPEEQVPLNPPNQPNQLPDIPPNQPNQVPNNPPNPQPNPPTGQPDQPQDPPANPLNQPPNPPPNQPPNPPANPTDPMANQAPQLNWSYFKPEFSGKPEEDAVAHLLRKNDWMETHEFPDDAKVRRFCLTLTGKARLWCESLRHLEIDWEALQEHLDNNIQNLVVQENSIFMCGDYFITMKVQIPSILM